MREAQCCWVDGLSHALCPDRSLGETKTSELGEMGIMVCVCRCIATAMGQRFSAMVRGHTRAAMSFLYTFSTEYPPLKTSDQALSRSEGNGKEPKSGVSPARCQRLRHGIHYEVSCCNSFLRLPLPRTRESRCVRTTSYVCSTNQQAVLLTLNYRSSSTL